MGQKTDPLIAPTPLPKISKKRRRCVELGGNFVHYLMQGTDNSHCWGLSASVLIIPTGLFLDDVVLVIGLRTWIGCVLGFHGLWIRGG